MGRTGHDGDHEPGEVGGEGRKRIDLSLSQVAGAGAATLTAATAASYLNVYGTVIGAAVIAILSTVASPLLQHWFSRGGEQARQLATRVRPGDAARAGGSLPPAAHGAEPAPDATRTMVLPTVADGPGGPGRAGAAGGPDADAPARARLGWRTVVVPAGVVFVLVMLVILAFEVLTGRSLTAWTNGVDGQTSPSLLGGTQVTQEQDDTGPTGTEGTLEQDTGTTGTTDEQPLPPPSETQAPDDTTVPDAGTGQDGPDDQDGQQEQPDPGATAPPQDGGAEGGDQTSDPGPGDGQESVVVPEEAPVTP